MTEIIPVSVNYCLSDDEIDEVLERLKLVVIEKRIVVDEKDYKVIEYWTDEGKVRVSRSSKIRHTLFLFPSFTDYATLQEAVDEQVFKRSSIDEDEFIRSLKEAFGE